MTTPAKLTPEVNTMPIQAQTYRDPHEVLGEKLEAPADLAKQLDAYERNRKTLMTFIAKHLHESEYEEKDGRKLPKAGAMNDYYLVPGATTKALTKLGAEKLGSLFRFFRGDTDVTHQVCTKEHCEVRVRATLVDQYNRRVGAFESACSSAERPFQNAKRKYNGDFRAALNDIVARASKRAFVQAMIYSTATDEIFQAAAELDEQQAEQESKAPPTLPKGKFGKWGGSPISAVPTTDLEKIYQFCRDATNPTVWAPVRDAVGDELELRRDYGDEDLSL